MLFGYHITKIILFLYVLYLPCEGYTKAAVQDQVTSLPNSPTLLSAHFSGYFNVSSTRFIHYYYVESENNPASDPVIFWTNGGPGCSGLIGMFTEMGPFRPLEDGSLILNPYAWSKVASMVFLEQPVGVGFSYATGSSDMEFVGDFYSGRDNVEIIRQFFRRFPERKNNDFYLSSESYGGHYIPQWTLNILEQDDLVAYFKGFLLGNPYVNWASLNVGILTTAWGLQLLPGPEWKEYVRNNCTHPSLTVFEFSKTCSDMFDNLFDYIDSLNSYAFDFPTCTNGVGSLAELSPGAQTNSKPKFRLSKQAQRLLQFNDRILSSNRKQRDEGSSQAFPDHNRLLRVYAAISEAKQSKLNNINSLKRQALSASKIQYAQSSETDLYDPCQDDYAHAYLNMQSVQEAMNVIRSSSHLQGDTIKWESCDDTVYKNWFQTDFIYDVTKLYGRIYNHPQKPKGFKMLVYSGDSDGVCATVGTQHWVYNIDNAEIQSLWKPWIVDGQPAGFLTRFNDSLSFATVHYAGHEVPAYQPANALHLLQEYLNGNIFNVTSYDAVMLATESASTVDDPTIAMIVITIISGIMLIYVIYQRAKEIFADEDDVESASSHLSGNQSSRRSLLRLATKKSMPQLGVS